MLDHVTYCGLYCKRCPEHNNGCMGCRQGGADPTCQPRLCAEEREVLMCAICEEYPCKSLAEHIERLPSLVGEAREIREKGIEAWIQAQEKLVDKKYY